MPDILDTILFEIQSLTDDEKQTVLDFIVRLKRLYAESAFPDDLLGLAESSWTQDWNHESEQIAWDKL